MMKHVGYLTGILTAMALYFIRVEGKQARKRSSPFTEFRVMIRTGTYFVNHENNGLFENNCQDYFTLATILLQDETLLL